MKCDHAWQPDAVLLADGSLIPLCTRCGETPRASATQVDDYQLCPSKWGRRRRERRGRNVYADYGDRCHTILENWGKHGTPPDARTKEGLTVLSALHLLPPPRTAVHEGELDVVLWGIGWRAKIDWILGVDPGRVVVFGDLKTTGSIDKNAKSSEVLSTMDPQGIAYSHILAERHEVPHVVGTWVYAQRDCRAPALPVVFSITREEAAARFRDMHYRTVLPMTRARALPIEALERRLDSCDAYGGCEFRRECLANISPIDRAAAMLYSIGSKSYTDRNRQENQAMAELPTIDVMTALRNNAIATQPSAAPMPASAMPPNATGYVTVPTFAPGVQQWIDGHPPEQRDAARQQALASGHQPVAPTLPASAPMPSTPAPVSVPLQQPAAPVYTPTPQPAPVVIHGGAGTGAPLPQLAAPTAPQQFLPTTVPPVTGAVTGRPRAPKAQGSKAVTLLEICAKAQLPPEQAQQYLAMLKTVEAEAGVST